MVVAGVENERAFVRAFRHRTNGTLAELFSNSPLSKQDSLVFISILDAFG